jgi:NCAIR mutase (PurE)-related protein
MDEPTLAALLEAVRLGATPIEDAIAALRRLPYTDLGVAKVDHHRALRQGMPEVVFGEGKTADEIVAIVGALVAASQNVLVTRVGADAAAAIRAAYPETSYNARARTARLTSRAEPRRDVGFVAIVTAGTSDLGVAEEAAETLDALGIGVAKHYDVGVAGIHRLLHRVDDITRASAVIVVAGMEGALPSVVGGIVSCPVIGVPTSVGYGTAFGGVTPLFAMLTSCASGLAVVNIDNGFGAAMVAHRMLTGVVRSATNG